jgi:hypothetical protein
MMRGKEIKIQQQNANTNAANVSSEIKKRESDTKSSKTPDISTEIGALDKGITFARKNLYPGSSKDPTENKDKWVAEMQGHLSKAIEKVNNGAKAQINDASFAGLESAAGVSTADNAQTRRTKLKTQITKLTGITEAQRKVLFRYAEIDTRSK